MTAYSLETLEEKMGNYWFEILSTPVAKEIKKILASGDKKLYALWLCQVAHLTKHTSAHQALVGTRFNEISIPYMKFCYEHALEEVGHELMAVHDLRKIGANVEAIKDLPPPMQSTEQLTAYLYYAAERAHPATRLGFSFWAEKCYPYIQSLAGETQKSLGLKDHQMTFFVSHSKIDEKHANDVEKVIKHVCQTEADWKAVETGMIDTLNMAIKIFEEILTVTKESASVDYVKFLAFTEEK
jgi:hypothetical protein